MKLLNLSLLFLALGALILTEIPSCAHVQQATADACADTPAIVDAVTAALKHETFGAELSKIVAELCAIRAAVVEVVQREETTMVAVQASAALDPVSSAIVVNGRAWLDAHPTVPTGVKAGLPGGGHNCCWRAGTWHTIVTPPACPSPAVSLTPSNLLSHCSCAPIALWC